MGATLDMPGSVWVSLSSGSVGSKVSLSLGSVGSTTDANPSSAGPVTSSIWVRSGIVETGVLGVVPATVVPAQALASVLSGLSSVLVLEEFFVSHLLLLSFFFFFSGSLSPSLFLFSLLLVDSGGLDNLGI